MDIALLYEKLASPAVRALEGLGLGKLEDLSLHTRLAVSELHGIGPRAMKLIEEEMAKAKIGFKKVEGVKRPDREAEAALVERYIQGFPKETREKLEELRQTIRSAAPEATEIISYQMPTFFLDGNLVYYAGFKEHIGFYPTPHGITAFEAELAPYKRGKGSIRFPLDEPLPVGLIRKIVKLRVEENSAKARQAQAKKGARKTGSAR
jgi:uncharacterized protein YdhG (YjbR/CyaY superfamily)